MAANVPSLSKAVLGLDDRQIEQLASSLGIPETHKDISHLQFTDEEWGNNAKIREAVAYIGFDAKKIVAEFFKKVDSNKRGENDALLTVGEFTLYEKNDAKTDLMFFLNVFLERGNNLQKALLPCDDVVAPVLRRKAQAYGITLEKTQNRSILGTRHLTLARLAQAFPHATATLILKDGIKSKLDSKLFPGLPLLMAHTIFPALIPAGIDGITDILREVAQFINVEMSFMLADPKQKRKMAVRSLEDLLEQSTMFVDAAMNGSVIATPARVSILRKAGIVSVTPTITLTAKMAVVSQRLNDVKRFQMHPLAGCIAQADALRAPETSSGNQ